MQVELKSITFYNNKQYWKMNLLGNYNFILKGNDKMKKIVRKSVSIMVAISLVLNLVVGNYGVDTYAASYLQTDLETFELSRTDNFSFSEMASPSTENTNKFWSWEKSSTNGILNGLLSKRFSSLYGSKSLKMDFNAGESATLNNPNGNQMFDFSKDGITFWANSDSDRGDLFDTNYNIDTNDLSVGLQSTDSATSVKFHITDWGYPTARFAGDLSKYKTVKFWAYFATNDYSNGFTGPAVPISNMATGATITSGILNQWTQITMNISDMNNQSFGFLVDRAPILSVSLDMYIDKIEFINKDKDVADMFTASSGLNILTNTDSQGLKDANSDSSVRMSIPGFNGYPKATINGDMSQYKAIKFDTLVKAGYYSPEFASNVDISNMTTGVSLATLTFNQWTSVTLNLSNLSENAFGFLSDRAPLIWQNVDFYFDNIELIKADTDSPNLFTTSALSISENADANYLFSSTSDKSLFTSLPGWQYPTVTVNGDMSANKAIKFKVFAKKNQYTSPSFTGIDVPFSNMITGATIANAKLDRWTELTLNFSDMSDNSFGFIHDAGNPLAGTSLDIYIDDIEFVPNTLVALNRADTNAVIKVAATSFNGNLYTAIVDVKDGFNKYYIPYSAFNFGKTSLRDLANGNNFLYNFKFNYSANTKGMTYENKYVESNNNPATVFIDDLGFYSGDIANDANTVYLGQATPTITFPYNVSNSNVITGISENMNKVSFLSGVAAMNIDITVLGSNVEISDSAIVGTGTIVKADKGIDIAYYTVVLKGDVDGDGQIVIADLALVKQNILRSISFDDITKLAADTSNDTVVSISDLLKIKKHILNITSIIQ